MVWGPVSLGTSGRSAEQSPLTCESGVSGRRMGGGYGRSMGRHGRTRSSRTRGGGCHKGFCHKSVCRSVPLSVRTCSPFEKGILHSCMGEGGVLHPLDWGWRGRVQKTTRGGQPAGLPSSGGGRGAGGGGGNNSQEGLGGGQRRGGWGHVAGGAVGMRTASDFVW